MEVNEMAVPARKRKPQRRSAETRLKLARATIELMVERGYAGLSVTDIQARAGVSNGARVHHFPTKASLVIAAVAEFLKHGNRSGGERARAAAQPRTALRAMIEDLYTLYFEEFFIPAAESAIAARTDKVLAKGLHPVVAEYHRTNRGIWCNALERAGYTKRDARFLYELCKWVLRGMALTSMWHPTPAANRKFLADLERTVLSAVPPRALQRNGNRPVQAKNR
jgi:AcrR family transcriptional regulator